MADVFLSYASEDRGRLGEFVQYLESSGLAVFWDRDLPPGSSWREIFGRELEIASVVVVVWSRHSVASEWVIKEAEAAKRNKRLVPVCIDLVEPPIGFRGVQMLDLSNLEPGSNGAKLELLGVAIRERLGRSLSLEPVAHAAFAPQPLSKPPVPNLSLGFIVGAGALLVSGLLLVKLAGRRAPVSRIAGATLTARPSATPVPRSSSASNPPNDAAATQEASAGRTFESVVGR